MVKNEKKSMKKCFHLLFKNLQHLQHKLNSIFRIEKFFHNKLINAYQDILACQYVCFKSSNNLTGLINDLKSFIIIFQKINLNTKTFFVDRRYHNDSNFSRHEQRNSRYSRPSYKNKRTYHEPRRDDKRHEDKRVSYKDRQKKKRFVCHQKNC